MILLLRSILLACVLASAAGAQSVRGSGSTFCYAVMTEWTRAYAKATGIEVTYQPIGSAAGIAEVRQEVVDFALSEAPLNDAQLLRDGLLQFPLLIGAVVPIVNIPQVGPGLLRLSGPLLADIYLGKVSNWSDKQIATLNPDLTLPDLAIRLVHRNDGSGTTYVWTNYLSNISDGWRAQVGEGTTVRWREGYGAKGNADLAAKVMRLRGGIGYLDYPYARAHKLTFALVSNRAGRFVIPEAASFAAAAGSVDWRPEEGFNVALSDSAAPDAYPIMAVSFALIRKRPSDSNRTAPVLAFLRWAVDQGSELAAAQSYLPLPPPLARRVEAAWETGPTR